MGEFFAQAGRQRMHGGRECMEASGIAVMDILSEVRRDKTKAESLRSICFVISDLGTQKESVAKLLLFLTANAVVSQAYFTFHSCLFLGAVLCGFFAVAGRAILTHVGLLKSDSETESETESETKYVIHHLGSGGDTQTRTVDLCNVNAAL